MNKTKIFWGVILIVGAALLILEGYGIFDGSGIGIVNILFGVVLFGIFVNGIIDRSFGGMLFSLAFLCIVFSDALKLGRITPWPVLLAALLGTIGLNLIFPKRKLRIHKDSDVIYSSDRHRGTGTAKVDNVDGEIINFHSSLGACVKYINSDNLREVNADCRFGAMEIYFDNAIIQGGTAVLNINASFSGVELHIPKEWNVINNLKTSCGAVNGDVRNTEKESLGSSTLIINGNVAFGAVDIEFI